jgi:hypothetical protein
VDTYDAGASVQIRATFLVASVPTDPATLVARVRRPDGTEAAYAYGTDAALVREGAGHYRLDLVPAVVGTWWVTWEPTGAGQVGQEATFAVRAVQLCSLADLEDLIQVAIPAGDLDAANAAIATAGAVIRTYTGQRLTFVADESVLLTGRGVPEVYLPELPVTAVSAVSERGIALDAGTQYDWEAAGRLVRLYSAGSGLEYPARARGWYPGWRAVSVTYSHGYAVLPADLVDVAARVAARRYLGGKRSALVGPHARESDYAAVFQGEGTTDASGAYGPTSAPMLTGHERLILDQYRPLPLGLAAGSYSAGPA